MTPAVATPLTITIRKTTIHLRREDITELEVDGFVYYAQPDLALGSGFGGAIAVRGGASIQKELDERVGDGPVRTGEAVVSGAGKLAAKFIIHAVGPRFREEGIRGKLLETVQSSLFRAEEKGMRTLAFPLMGAGYYGIPPEVSAEVMLEGLRHHLEGGSGLEEVHICVFDSSQFNAVQAAFAAGD
ncbi:MAG: macro domain-containing protein [Gemmatimonadota bacterium]